MDAADVMGILEAKGKPNTVKIYRRHGVTGESFGVSYGDLEKLVKQIGIDQALALALWRTRNHDARVLATKIADPMRMTGKQIETWISDAGDHVITAAVATVAARMPDALDMARAWIASPDELVSAAGWQIMGTLGLEGGLAGEDAEPLIAAIRAGIHDAPNRTRYSMNNALIAIGGGMESMRAAALAAAKAIGTVYVDHGQTGCKTPDATSYIQRMIERAARKNAPAAKPAAKNAPAATKQPPSRQQG